MDANDLAKVTRNFHHSLPLASAWIGANDSAVDHPLRAFLFPLAWLNVDDAIADPRQAWINAKDPQRELAGQGQFEFRAIARFIALKHLAEHLDHPIAGVNLLQRVFAQSMAQAARHHAGNIVFADLRAPFKGG